MAGRTEAALTGVTGVSACCCCCWPCCEYSRRRAWSYASRHVRLMSNTYFLPASTHSTQRSDKCTEVRQVRKGHKHFCQEGHEGKLVTGHEDPQGHPVCPKQSHGRKFLLTRLQRSSSFCTSAQRSHFSVQKGQCQRVESALSTLPGKGISDLVKQGQS